MVITRDVPPILARVRPQLPGSLTVVSDPAERAASALCGGLAHCQVLLDGEGVVRWAGWSESWSDAPPPALLLEAASRLR